ncbi:MAG: EpsG family protein [Pseudomonadota bacterium]|nr:EpsG family protein [Pseudomonadota bacterium]
MNPARRAGWGTTLLGLAFVLALMGGLREDFNPDWFGYAEIYQQTGAWLAEQGRDPLFVVLTGTLRTLLGPDSYDAFRFVVAAYFAGFTVLLLRGRVIPFGSHVHRWPMLLLGLLPFIAPRFTIQIREGLALTLVIFGMAALAGGSKEQDKPAVWSAVLLFVAAAALHSGVAILLLALLAGLLIGNLCAHRSQVESWLLLSAALIAVALAAALTIFGIATDTGTRAIESIYGALADTDITLSLAKWIYWLAYGFGVATVAGRVHALYGSPQLPSRLRPVLGVIAMVMLPAIYVAALLLLAGGAPAIAVSGAARLMNMLLSVTLLVLALRGALNLRLGLFALLVLVDQGRVILEAVLGLTGSTL